jgi:A118 family predicted phage portal protein
MFLKPNSKFPPEIFSFWSNKYQEWEVWYSGDPEILMNYYTIVAASIETAKDKFWARIEREERASIVHLPSAGDIASTSANLLFAEKPRFKYDENVKSGERIKNIIEENGFENLLLEGAEISAALSGCILKIDVEPGLIKLPIISIISPTQFFPTFWRGRLWEILFFRIVKESKTGSYIWRLFENRRREGDSLIIEYKLYKGTSDSVGSEVDFDSIEETSNFNFEPVIYNNIGGLGCVYVPNMKPNKLEVGSALGINDYSSQITLMDSLDFVWTSWIRDIELGLSQIFIDEELITKSKSETSGELSYLNKFSKYQKAFTKLNLTAWRMGGDTGAKPIESIQFNIRVDEHAKTCEQLFYQIVTQSGYSPQTFGLGNFGQAESGTALRIREHKSQLTREKKSRYWIPAIKSLLFQAQQIDIASNLSARYESQVVGVEIEDSVIVDSSENSNVLRNLEQARAISTFAKVKMLHPDWDDDQVDEEVKRINAEQGITDEVFNNDNEKA